MLTKNKIKNAARHALHPTLLSAIQGLRGLWYVPDPQVSILRDSFEQLNEGSPQDSIVMRRGVTFRIGHDSREPFQWFCWKSPTMVQEFDRFLEVRGKYRRFLDLGANHGVYSLAFVAGRPDAESVAVDPSPLAFPILLSNVSANAAHIQCLQLAAGDQDGQLRMKLNWHHLEVIPDQSGGETKTIKIVPVRKMDDVCMELGFIPDLVKVDVEGFELAALRGLERILTSYRPVVFLEIHHDLIRALGYSASALTKFAATVDYHFENLKG